MRRVGRHHKVVRFHSGENYPHCALDDADWGVVVVTGLSSLASCGILPMFGKMTACYNGENHHGLST